jgi:A/G-specific adenine glycosylase
MFDRKKIKKFNLRLYHWYKKNNRGYPWRSNPDLYSLLVAEILLQKTNADKVVPAYLEIINRYPTAQKLVRARRKTLERIILPLGLIGKVDILKQMAERIISWGNTNVSRQMLLGIKGVGDYIANSVLIHWKHKRLPLLDPNFIRIYKRVFGLTSNHSRPRTDKQLWENALHLIPRRNVSRYACAILDFGAVVCRARNPKCLECTMYPDVCLGVLKGIKE